MPCPRPGCGALYHADCWRECLASYGGCAVYGCLGPPRLAPLPVRFVRAVFLWPRRLLRLDAEHAESGKQLAADLALGLVGAVFLALLGWGYVEVAARTPTPVAFLGGTVLAFLVVAFVSVAVTWVIAVAAAWLLAVVIDAFSRELRSVPR